MTSTPLVWNFNLVDSADQISTVDYQQFEMSPDLKWERRYFWSQDQFITIRGLSPAHLQLSQYRFKTRQDTYILNVCDKPNIKLRNGKIAYKPLVCVEDKLYGYAKKQKFDCHSPTLVELLPKLTLGQALSSESIAQHYDIFETYKEAFILDLNQSLKARFEIARIEHQQHCFYSACIEAKSKALVQTLSEILLKDQHPTTYPLFIESLAS